MERIIRRLEAEPMTRIVALGSSNTELAYHSEGCHNWFGWLEVGLRDRFGRVHHAINAGVSGETSRDMLARFDRDVAHYRPHLVIITTGGNDCSPENDLPRNEFEGNLRALVARCRALSDCLVILQTYYAFDVAAMGDEPERARRFPEYMDSVREVSCTDEAILLDHLVRWERLRLQDYATYAGLMRDAMHLNPWGNMVMGLDALRQFGAAVTGETAERCAKGVAVQAVLDQLGMG